MNHRMAANHRFDTDPSQRRFAPLLRAGQAERLGGKSHLRPQGTAVRISEHSFSLRN
jgi:hypothetical protein